MTFQHVATIVFVIGALVWQRRDVINASIKITLGLLALWGAVCWT